MKKRILTGFIAGLMTISMLAGCGGSSSSGGYKASDSSYAASEPMAEAAAGDYYDDYAYETEEAYDDAGSVNKVSEGTEEVEVEESSNSSRKLIRTVYLEVEAYDFPGLNAAVTAKVKALGGYIETSSVDGNNNSTNRYATYTLRIPKANADAFIESVSQGGNVTHQSENMEDVTLKYVDINSRKESLKTEYKRLEDLLEQAADVEELIYIESRMSEVRYEIESIESQLRTYDNLVDYSTIHLTINEVREYTEPEPEVITLGDRIKKAFTDAVENVIDILQGLLVALVAIIPYLILIAVVVLIIALIVWLIRTIINKVNPPEKRQAKAYEKAMKKSNTRHYTAPASSAQNPGQPPVQGAPAQGPQAPGAGTPGQPVAGDNNPGAGQNNE